MLNRLSGELIVYDPGEAKVLSDEARLLAAELGNERERCVACYHFGMACNQLSEHDAALENLNLASQIAEAIDDRLLQAKTISGYGQIQMRLSMYNEGLNTFMKAHALYTELGDMVSVSSVLTNMGAILSYLGRRQEAIEFFFRSLEIKEQNEDWVGIAKTYNNIGTEHYHMKDYAEAKKYYLKALELKEKHGMKRSLTSSLGNLGNLLIDMHEFEQASEYLERSLALSEELGDERAKSYSLNNLGLIQLKIGNPASAAELCGKACEIAMRLRDNYGISYFSLDLARAKMELKEIGEGEKWCRQSLDISNTSGHLEQKKDGYELLSLIYRLKQDFENALQCFMEFTRLKDELISQESINRIAEIQTRFETERKEREKEIYRLRNIELAEANETIRQKNTELTEAYRKMETLARIDPLTKLSNRRDFLEKMSGEGSVLLLDIDDFKEINDNLGHDTGDRVLCMIAKRLAETVCEKGIAGRWGGEEFIVFLPDTPIHVARNMAESIRTQLSEPFNDPMGSLQITVSIGASHTSQATGDKVQTISIMLADRALYQGKRAGKNCVRTCT